MSLRTSQKSSTTTYRTVNVAPQETTYRTVNVASPETTYRTLNVASPETTYRTVNVAPQETTYRTVNVASPEVTYRTLNVAPQEATTTVISARSMSPLQTVSPIQTVSPVQNGAYETVRYLVPVQQAMQQQQSYYMMQQPMMQQMVQPMVQQMVQPMVQQMQCVSPVYMQSLPRMSVSSQESDIMYLHQQTVESNRRKSSSVFSQSSSPVPQSVEEEEQEEEEEVVEEEEEEVVEEEEVEVEEVEIINIIQQKPPPPPAIERITRTEVRTELREGPQPVKMDTRYFGELLADVYRKNCDIHSCISEHVSKIRGQKHQLDPSNDYKVEKEEVEALIPKGATELTKQQIRYLLQTRLTADKSMRLLLATFSSLREELLHMSDDLRRLESEKETLERDLSFKADQARQYDSLLENVRENNRQLQMSLKETSSSQRSLESQLMSSRNTDSSREFKIKELEGRMRAMEKENEMLRHKLSGEASSSTLRIKTEELSRQYKDQLSSIRQEKDQEIQRLRTQITRIQTEVSSSVSSSSDQSLQLKISELLAMLEQRQTTITWQEEEIKKLTLERNSSSKSQVTKTVITNRYRQQYPILGLLGDDYQYTSPIKEDKTILIERTGGIIQ